MCNWGGVMVEPSPGESSSWRAKGRMDENKIYQELALAWRHFASWREKVFAGYLAVLAALSVAFTKSQSPALRVTIFAAAILVSLVFWLLDVRNGQLINACQVAAEKLERGKPGFAALNVTRFGESTWLTSYGFAIDLLVSGVLGASGGGLYIYFTRLSEGAIGLVAPAICVVTFACFILGFQQIRRRRWAEEKANSEAQAKP